MKFVCCGKARNYNPLFQGKKTWLRLLGGSKEKQFQDGDKGMKNRCEKTQLAGLHICCTFNMHSVHLGDDTTVKKKKSFPLPVFATWACCPLRPMQCEEVVLMLPLFPG